MKNEKKEEKEKKQNIIKIKNIIMKVLNENGFKDAKIILFGSRAKGDFKTLSDWDFLIVLKKELSMQEKRDISHFIRKALADIYIPSDVIVRSEDEVERRKNVIGSVIRSAIKTGIVI
ncbi:nucleotidyltransferase domain-containing protein [bacterium]|nr:nucleotidyltransferase domain-containing protein [bacterium]